MTIGIICAIPQELGHLADAMREPRHEPVAGLAFRRGTLDGHDVVLAGGGVGKVNAAITATLLAIASPAAASFSGVAAGRPGAPSRRRRVMASAPCSTTRAVLQGARVHTYQAGHVPFFNPTDALGLDVPEALLAASRTAFGFRPAAPLGGRPGGASAPHHHFGPPDRDQFLNCEATASGCSWSSAAGRSRWKAGVGQVAMPCHPHLVFRALSDLAGAESPIDFGHFVEEWRPPRPPSPTICCRCSEPKSAVAGS
jgi:adenosylhomocysteine nucleosidase